MKAIDCIKTRRSVRSYKDKKIPNDIIEDIMECANLAPSAMARYPWRFVVVTNKDKMAKMADAATHGKFISGAAACEKGQRAHYKGLLRGHAEHPACRLVLQHWLLLGQCLEARLLHRDSRAHRIAWRLRAGRTGPAGLPCGIP
jgi:nitroreductase